MGVDGDEEREARPTMAEVSHANPRTGSTLGEIFRRGPVVADGGTEDRPTSDDDAPTDDRPTSDDDASTDDRSMVNVDHTARRGDGRAIDRVWSRGNTEGNR
ncbi:hypothetical protein [Halorubrum vacuolatum]|uniref:Uncharacterized protein n=1 Tax=Halorubrum vacuolatum TaxID=63740 RepID=A0A238WKG4_HALVU|nr:hypothetical protein [Halorubrum vacuolatum]SNR46831.1 hypothetical protein SAMN06264855_10881 [Halorubrum vacuolatum]